MQVTRARASRSLDTTPRAPRGLPELRLPPNPGPQGVTQQPLPTQPGAAGPGEHPLLPLADGDDRTQSCRSQMGNERDHSHVSEGLSAREEGRGSHRSETCACILSSSELWGLLCAQNTQRSLTAELQRPPAEGPLAHHHPISQKKKASNKDLPEAAWLGSGSAQGRNPGLMGSPGGPGATAPACPGMQLWVGSGHSSHWSEHMTGTLGYLNASSSASTVTALFSPEAA